MIFAHQPSKTKLDDGTTTHSVNTVFQNGKKTISISFDDSCGRMSRLRRSDLRLFIDQGEHECQDETGKVFPNAEHWGHEANLENFQKAWEWLNE